METIRFNKEKIKRLCIQCLALLIALILMGFLYFNSSYSSEGFLFFGFALSLFGGAILVTSWSNEIDELKAEVKVRYAYREQNGTITSATNIYKYSVLKSLKNPVEQYTETINDLIQGYIGVNPNP